MNNQTILIIMFVLAFAVLLLLVIKDKRYKWNDMEVIPEPSKYNERISEDIIIRDLVTEKEFRAYFDHSRQHYIDYKCNMVCGAFIWRYDE